MGDMMVYICSRRAWNPSLDPGLLQDESFECHYGNAATTIREYLVKPRRIPSTWPSHENCNAPYYCYGLTEKRGREGVAYFDEALKLADSPEVRNRVEKALICAHRLAMGKVWYGTEPENMTGEIKAEYRRLARNIFALCEKHGVNEHGESRPIEGVVAKVCKALQMGRDKRL